MITKDDFESMRETAEKAVNYSFDLLLEKSKEDYILFLAKGDYLKNISPNPYMIDYQKWKIVDSTRLEFLTVFMNTYYSFPKNVLKVNDDKIRLHLEMMIYSHCWESFSFLRSLFRLAHLLNGEEYIWSINIDKYKRFEFINKEIRDVFKSNNIPIYDLVLNGYDSSLRNAFAHSQYFINLHDKKIDLFNYSGKPYELENISFDDWTSRFLKSVLLSYFMEDIIYNRRVNLVNFFKSNTFSINHLSNDGKKIIKRDIVYCEQKDSFHFKPRQP